MVTWWQRKMFFGTLYVLYHPLTKTGLVFRRSLTSFDSFAKNPAMGFSLMVKKSHECEILCYLQN